MTDEEASSQETSGGLRSTLKRPGCFITGAVIFVAFVYFGMLFDNSSELMDKVPFYERQKGYHYFSPTDRVKLLPYSSAWMTNSPPETLPFEADDERPYQSPATGEAKPLPPATESYSVTMDFYQMHGGRMPEVKADARFKKLEKIMEAIKRGDPVVTILKSLGEQTPLLDWMPINIEFTDANGKLVKTTELARPMWPGKDGKEFPADANQSCITDLSNSLTLNLEEPYICKAEIDKFDFKAQNIRVTARRVSDGQIIAEHDLIWDPESKGWMPSDPVVEAP